MADTQPPEAKTREAEFVKVWRRVGAVAVYNRGRAIAIVVGLVALVAAIAAAAFLGGRASKDDATAAPAPAPPTAAQPAPASTARSPGTNKALVHRTYRRGYRAGARAAAPGGSAFFKPGQAYLVKIQKGRNGTPYAIGPHVRIAPGFRYRICAGGSQICELPITGTTP